MKAILSKAWIVLIAALLLTKCRVPYDPPVKNSNDRLLVVEGYINADGETSVKLSRTRNITWGDTALLVYESDAKVIIEDNNSHVYPLSETVNGTYSASYNLPENALYRLHITTADNKEYISDFVHCKVSPLIDTISWSVKNRGIKLYANTHDPNNNTRFYRWTYQETYEIHSFYNSSLIFNSTLLKVVPRTEQVYRCWVSENSSGVFLASSSKLLKDVINKAPLNFIPFGDKRISVLYSILVSQYTLDSSGYNYWNAVKGNSEDMGSIFAAQPSQFKGNIHCITDSENVIGYINAGTIQQQRIFINNNEVPSNWNSPPPCVIDSVPKDSIVYYLGGSLGLYPIDTIITSTRYAYTSSFINCVDCTIYGSNVKPSFWP